MTAGMLTACSLVLTVGAYHPSPAPPNIGAMLCTATARLFQWHSCAAYYILIHCDFKFVAAFNATFGDTMVLQQSPAKACVYGVLGEGGTGATVKISAQDAKYFAVYEVQATVQPGSSLWNACLRPQKAGAEKFTIAATCIGCANTTAATISDVVFGDVWFVNIATRIYCRNCLKMHAIQ